MLLHCSGASPRTPISHANYWARDAGAKIAPLLTLQAVRLADYEAMPEVRADRLRIGIGVRDPSWPYGFLVGVACDCASCHSGVTARDRDRQRQQMFEALGWRLDSVWSMD